MDTNELAHRIVNGFLIPAVEATDHHERWKLVNRAAGVVAGFGAAAGLNAAQLLAGEIVTLLAGHRERLRPEIYRRGERDHLEMILGPNGLPKRLAACVAALSE